MKTTKLILSKTEFEKRNGKLYHKVLQKIESPDWFNRAEKLKAQGLEDFEIAQKLNSEGYTAKFGGPINTDTIRCKRANLKKNK
jgi:hypothetical protein